MSKSQIEIAIAEKLQKETDRKAAEAANEAAKLKEKQDKSREFMLDFLRLDPLWEELKQYAEHTPSTQSHAIIVVDATELRLWPFTFATISANTPAGMITYTYWKGSINPERTGDLTDLCLRARRIFEQAEEDGQWKASKKAEDETAAALLEAKVKAYESALMTYAEQLAVVHSHNRAMIEPIARNCNRASFNVQAVEIGIVARDGGAEVEETWVDTDTRITLGKDEAGYWLELDDDGDVTPKIYMNVVAVAMPQAQSAATSHWGITVNYQIAGHSYSNPVAKNWEQKTYPPIKIPPDDSIKKRDVVALIRALDLLPEPEMPVAPEEMYNHHQDLVMNEAYETYCAAMRNALPLFAPEKPAQRKSERVADVDF